MSLRLFALLSVLHGVEQLDDSFGGFGPVEGFSRPVVEFVGDGVEVVLAVSGKVCALGEALAQQAVGVLIGAALPWAARVAEVDLHVQCGGDPAVQGELGALVPGQRVEQRPWQPSHLVDDGLLHVFGVVAVGQGEQDRVAGCAFHERADGAPVGGPADQVALPMARGPPGRRRRRAVR